MIVFSSSEFDPLGSLVVQESSNTQIGTLGRRSSRISTLDGGAVLVDYGYTDADREMKIKFKATRAQLTSIQRLVSLWSNHVLSCSEGVFYGVIQGISESKGTVTATFLPIEKLS